MSKTYDEALAWASSLLVAQNIDPDGARYVLEVRNDFSPSDLRLRGRERMPEAIWMQFQADVARLRQYEPAQYIVGTAPFFGRMFTVTPDVLIPRFETEELVAWAVAEQTQANTGLDLGTGSGVIGLTIKRQLPNVAMTLADISQAALTIAQKNARAQQLDVRFIESDLFDALPERYDFIISNLPYIGEQERDVMDESTLRFEPEGALFAAEAGLELFRRFVAQVGEHINPGGRVYLEFGYRQQPALAALFAHALPQANVTFRRDMAGHPRMVRLTF